MAIERSWSEYYKIKWPFRKHFDAQFHGRDWSMSSTITGNFTGFFRIFHFSNFVRAWIFLLGTSRERGEETAPDRCLGVDGYLNVAREITDLYPMTSLIWRRHQFLKSGKITCLINKSNVSEVNSAVHSSQDHNKIWFCLKTRKKNEFLKIANFLQAP